MFSEYNEHSIVWVCCSSVPYGWSDHFLCRLNGVFLLERHWRRLPRNRCMFGKACTLLELLAITSDRLFRYGHRSQRPRFAWFDDTWRSTASVCLLFWAQKTRLHRVQEYRPVEQALRFQSEMGWLDPFFSQFARVCGLTPNMRWMPRILGRSW